MNEEEFETGMKKTKDMLRASYSGYKQFRDSHGQDRIPGLYNAVNCGRSVTFTMQKQFGGKLDGFDEWYAEKQDFLKEDSVCSFMCELRNDIVHEGESGVSTYVKGHIDSDELYRKMPAWADGIFIGDGLGGSGFEIEQEDGSVEKFYYDFPNENIEADLAFHDLEDFADESGVSPNAQENLRYYIKVLAELVGELNREFGKTDENVDVLD